MATKRQGGVDVHGLTDLARRIESNIERVVEGKPDAVRLSLVALLAEGHVLLEDVPGVGKTLLAKALGQSIACSVRRVQFTPDLLPSDVTGVTIWNAEVGDFEFKPGAVFANIVLGDEINRAGPKTQSALLEAMEERQVTADGVTYELAQPFMVIATQNPVELEGTYPLPEAQRDRFLLRLVMGYPAAESELAILTTHGGADPLQHLQPVTDAREVAAAITAVAEVHAANALQRYIVDLVRASRSHPSVELGASPRAALAMLRATRALAVLEGRDYVVPDDVKALAAPVLGHRLIVSLDGGGASPATIVAELLDAVPVPNAA